MTTAILQYVEQASPKAWFTMLYSSFIAARQKQADARLAYLATQRSSFAKAKAEQARTELRMYSI